MLDSAEHATEARRGTLEGGTEGTKGLLVRAWPAAPISTVINPIHWWFMHACVCQTTYVLYVRLSPLAQNERMYQLLK